VLVFSSHGKGVRVARGSAHAVSPLPLSDFRSFCQLIRLRGPRILIMYGRATFFT
jgi:hypothetical protein